MTCLVLRELQTSFKAGDVIHRAMSLSEVCLFTWKEIINFTKPLDSRYDKPFKDYTEGR